MLSVDTWTLEITERPLQSDLCAPFIFFIFIFWYFLNFFPLTFQWPWTQNRSRNNSTQQRNTQKKWFTLMFFLLWNNILVDSLRKPLQLQPADNQETTLNGDTSTIITAGLNFLNTLGQKVLKTEESLGQQALTAAVYDWVCLWSLSLQERANITLISPAACLEVMSEKAFSVKVLRKVSSVTAWQRLQTF